jgi:hypothetical protein
VHTLPLKLAVAVGLSMVFGCELGDVTTNPQPALRVLDPSEEALVSVTPDALVVDTRARVLDGLGVGDVIVSSGAEPFLRRVVSIGGGGAQVALATEPGALTDAILDGQMHSSGDLFERDIVQGSANDLVIAIDRLELDFNNTKVIDSPDVQVHINRGTVRFRPSLDTDLQIENGWISHFHAILRGELSASMGVTITAGRSFDRSFSKTIWQSPAYRATQWVGVVPVVEVVRLSLVLSGEARASVSGTIELGHATTTATLEAGATYDRGRWRSVSRPAIAFDARGPSNQLGASAGASLRLRLHVDVRLYDIAGPYMTIGAYARSSVNTSSGWTGRVGLDGAFGGNVSVLGATLAAYEATLFDVGRGF